MSEELLLSRVHQMVEALHTDWFGNGQEGYRAKITRHDERLDALEERVDTATTCANRRAAFTGAVTAVLAAIATIFTKDKVGG